jgi:hypothetical protein
MGRTGNENSIRKLTEFIISKPKIQEMERSSNCLLKLKRLKKCLRHEEPDRVPISDFFWGSFIKRWKSEMNLPEDANPYNYYDLNGWNGYLGQTYDYIVKLVREHGKYPLQLGEFDEII